MIESISLQLQDALLRGLVETSPSGIVVLDQCHRVKCWSPSAATIFEIPADAALDKPIDDLVAIVSGLGEEVHGPIRLAGSQKRQTSSVSIEIEQIAHQIKIGDQDWTILYLNDVTLRRAKEQRLANEALTDPLSGLTNRRGFQEELESALAGQLTLAIIDVDNFKQINDRFGHEAGDRAIEHIAKQMRACFPEGVCVARLGGDEFGVVLKSASRLETESIFERLRHRIVEDLPSQYKFSVAVSIGVAVSSVPGTSARKLLKTADQNMYRAKASGGNRISIQSIDA
jgi:diguanylate cyclase (GGDEF)-like protein